MLFSPAELLQYKNYYNGQTSKRPNTIRFQPNVVLKEATYGHSLAVSAHDHTKGLCITCIINGDDNIKTVHTYCTACPQSEWICEGCLDFKHDIAQ